MANQVNIDDAIEEIRNRVDIVDLISQRIPLKRAGADFKACCPFHNEKTPSFIVSPSRRSFHCFGCGASGDVFKFLMLSDGMTFIESVKALALTCGVEIKERHDPKANHRKKLIKLHGELASFFSRCLVQINEASIARKYLSDRKINKKVIDDFRIGYVPNNSEVICEWAEKYKFTIDDLIESGIISPPREDREQDNHYCRFHGRLIFPICDQNGQVVAFSARTLSNDKKVAKYINSPETPIFKKSQILYGLSFAKKNITRMARREVIVCEGQIDVIRCHSCGFNNAVASQGTAFTEEHVKLLRAYADSALLVFDGDSAGIKAATRTGRLFLAEGIPVRVATLPQGEDPDSILRDRGNEAFQEALDSAISLAAFQVRSLQAAEENPSSFDAIARITQELLETFHSCSKAVLRSYLMQEAADLIGIPISALESDYEEYKNRKDQAKVYHKDTPKPHPQHSGLRTPNPELNDNSELRTPNSELNKSSELRTPNSELNSNSELQAATPQKRYVFRESALLAIADILIKTSTSPTDENRDAALFIQKWLPESIMGNTPEKEIIQAVIADWQDNGDRVATMTSETSGEVSTLIDHLSRRASPVLACDMDLLDIIKDEIAIVWIDYLKARRKQIDSSTPDGQTTRLQLSMLIRKLESEKNWDAREAIFRELI